VLCTTITSRNLVQRSSRLRNMSACRRTCARSPLTIDFRDVSLDGFHTSLELRATDACQWLSAGCVGGAKVMDRWSLSLTVSDVVAAWAWCARHDGNMDQSHLMRWTLSSYRLHSNWLQRHVGHDAIVQLPCTSAICCTAPTTWNSLPNIVTGSQLLTHWHLSNLGWRLTCLIRLLFIHS